MTFDQHLAKRRVLLGFVLRWRGVGTLFASFPDPQTWGPYTASSDTVDVDGDTGAITDGTYSTPEALAAEVTAAIVSSGTGYDCYVSWSSPRFSFVAGATGGPTSIPITLTAGVAAALGLPETFDLDVPGTQLGADVATAFRTIAGETYQWVEAISADEIIGASTEFDPWTGVPISGETPVGLRLVPELRALHDPKYVAAAKAVLGADASSSDASLTVDDTTPLGTDGECHLRYECMGYTVSSVTAIAITRGLYGSRPSPHYASMANVREFGVGGGYVATKPMVMDGRIADLWVVPLRSVDGVVSAYAHALDDVDNRRVATGPTMTSKSYGAGLVTCSIRNLASLLETEVQWRYPTASAGHGLGNYVQVDDDACMLAFGVFSADDGERLELRARLQRDDGTGTTEDVPVGLYRLDSIGRWIAWTVQQAGQAQWGSSFECIGSAWTKEDAAHLYLLVKPTVNYQLNLNPCERSVLPELGFEDAKVHVPIAITANGTASVLFEYEAGGLPPQFRLSARGLRRLYYRDRGEVSFVASPGWTDSTAAAVSGHVLVGEELIEFDGTGTDYPDGDAAREAVPYLSISRRAALGSSSQELVVEQDDDHEEVRQVLAFPATEWGRVFLYLWAGGFEAAGGYDQAWRGSGAALDLALVDSDSFEALGSELRDIVITEAMTLQAVLEVLLPQTQTAVVSESTLRLVDLDPITEDETDTATVITTADTIDVPDYDDGEDRIVNRVLASNLAYDPGTDKGESLTLGQGTSAGTWGYKDAVKIDCRWCGSFDRSLAVASRAFDRLAAKFGSRFAVIDARLLATVKAWSLSPGAAASLSHTGLPDGAGGLGMTDQLCRVWGVASAWLSQGSPRASVKLVAHDLDRSARRCKWAPSARGTSVTGAVITIAAAVYSDDDISHFAVGMAVRVSQPGTTTSMASTAEIAAIGTDTIELDTVVGFAAPVIVEFHSWNRCTEAQRRFAFMSDGSGVVGTDDAKKWS